MAASWTAVKMPESMLVFTVPSALMACGVAGGERDTPAGHVVRLRAAEQLDRDVLGAGALEQARRDVAVEADLGVRVVVHEQDVVLLGERDGAVEVLDRSGRPPRGCWGS